jgi:ATP-dependent helicase/nuclease subunit A
LVRAVDPEAELTAVAARVGELAAAGVSLEQICVLGRTHRNLMDVSRVLKDYGFPTHVHSSRGFTARREVIDAQALWKFLVNPHDNLNLLILLRSPWFFTEDWQLAEWMKDRPQSLWRRLSSLTETPESVSRLKQAGARLQRAGLVRTFEETLCSAAYLDLSLHNDPAGRKESNLWKLILKARALEREGGFSALDFLETAGAAADPLDASEGDATSAQEPNCINLMTIHGSKGLEFEHVILPRMGESPRTSVTVPLEASEGRFFFPIWNEAQGEFLASPLDYLSVRRKAKRELDEFDRWLYVALTRAKSTLTLTSVIDPARESWAERSPWFQKSAGRIESPAAGYAFEVVTEIAEPQPYAARAAATVGVREPWRAVAPEAPERQSVTDLVASSKSSSKPEDLVRRWQAQSLGTRIHKALEALKYGHESAQFDEPVQFVLGLVDPPMREVIACGHTEWGFQVQAAARVIEGQIDLWAKHGGRVYVVDYKSGSPKGQEDAFTQLSIYSWALRRFGHLEPIDMIVIYPLGEKVARREFTGEMFAHWEKEFGKAPASQPAAKPAGGANRRPAPTASLRESQP